MASTSTRDTPRRSTSGRSPITALARSIADRLRPCDRRISPSFARTGPYGAYGERVAACFLRREKFRVLLRNVRVGGGEIDLVCREGEVLSFVEVKTRPDSRY